MKQVFLSSTVTANTTLDITPSIIRQAPFTRVINGMCLSGATINTGTLIVQKNGLEILRITNGVTRAAGQPIDLVADLVSVSEIIEPNDQLTMSIANTTGGNLAYYVAFDIDEEQ